MNIVITGATSFIGTGIIKRLVNYGNNRIWAVIRPNSINKSLIPSHKNIHVIELDIQEIESLPQLVTEPIDVFYHLAWEGVRAPYRDDRKMQETNYLAALKAVRVCYVLKGKKFIGSGSQAEYGAMSGEITESYLCNPNTEYGKAKYKACCEIETYAAEHQMDFIWGRIFSIYGKGDFKGSLIMTCIDKMMKNETIPLTACVQEWDYLYIDEVAEIFAEFAEKNCKSGIYNVASGKHQKLKEYVEIMRQITKSESIIEYGKIPYPKQGMVSFIPVISKLQQELDWKSEINFEDGIKRILQR